MIIQQISVFVENQPGTLAEVLGILKANQVNLRALSVADTADFGILRMIVNEPEKVAKFLRDKGLAVKSTQVLTIAIPDNPGGLLEQVEKLSAAGINVEYVYAFAATSAMRPVWSSRSTISKKPPASSTAKHRPPPPGKKEKFPDFTGEPNSPRK